MTAFRPTDEQRRAVESMVSFGIPQVDIAKVIGISDETLRKHFREEIDTGAARAITRVASYLFEHATGQRGDGSPAITAAIFFLKTRARWRELAVTEHLVVPAASDMTLEDRERLAAEQIDRAFGRSVNSENKEH